MKKLFYICFYLSVFLALAGNPVHAQRTSARATVEPAEIMIGGQAVINLEVIAPKGRDIRFPVFPDTLVTGIEVLRAFPPDTVIAHEVMTLNQKYLVTSFDSTLYHIPYIAVLDGQDTIKSNSFGLKVTSPELHESVLAYLDRLKTQQTDSIDFDQLALADIKPNIQPPFVWQDYLSYLWLLLALVLVFILLAAAIFLGMRKKNKGYFFKPEVVLPPHVVALQALDKIKAEKIWQQGREKQFYTELTDVLREYIEKRFHINAFERTSDEILESIQIYAEAESSVDSLTQVLKLADLVKFAKYKPLPNENDLSIVNSYLFVNQTKIEAPVSLTDNQGEGTDEKGYKIDSSENPTTLIEPKPESGQEEIKNQNDNRANS